MLLVLGIVVHPDEVTLGLVHEVRGLFRTDRDTYGPEKLQKFDRYMRARWAWHRSHRPIEVTL